MLIVKKYCKYRVLKNRIESGELWYWYVSILIVITQFPVIKQMLESKYGLGCSVKSCFKGNELGLIFLQHCIAGLKKLMYVGKFKRLPIMEAS